LARWVPSSENGSESALSLNLNPNLNPNLDRTLSLNLVAGTQRQPLTQALSPSDGERETNQRALTLDPVVTERLRGLATASDPAVFTEIYTAFVGSAEEYLTVLLQAREAGDAEALRRAAHALKGAGANVGATALAEICRQL